MKFPGCISSYASCSVICVAAALAPVYAQSPPPHALLELSTCGRELRLFEDGVVVVSRDGIKTERRLSESRMRKLRQVIARGPCEQEWQRPLLPEAAPNDGRVVTASVYVGDCKGSVLSAGFGLQEVFVTRHYAGYERGTVVYILCKHAKESDKKMAKRAYPHYLKNSWNRFLTDVASTAGGKSILKDCRCGP